MSRLPFRMLRRQIQEPAGPEAAAPLSDRHLLERFVQERDETAFADLVRRHGPLVRGVCRRVLPHAQDAEDAFQATFLVLARRAGAGRWHDSVGNWLYCVAYRLALRVRGATRRRQALDQAAGQTARAPAPADTDLRELCAVVDEEVRRLPERLRISVLLCYLEGQTQDAAARQLGWSLRTLERRLEQGRELLRERLTARGVTLTAALLAAAWGRSATGAAIPAALVESTVRAACRFTQAPAVPPGTLSENAAVWAEELLRNMLVAKVKWAAALALAVCLLAGVGLWARQPREEPAAAQAPRVAPPARTLADHPPPRVDQQGDPLPPQAMARLGTVRWRHAGEVYAVAFAPDHKTLASAGEDRAVRLWDVATGREIQTFKHRVPVHAVAFAPEGKVVATAGKEEKVVRLWEVATGKELRTFAGHKDFVTSVAFAPDGKTLAAGGWDKTVRRWDVATGQEIQVLVGHEQGALAVAYAPDGKTLASAGRDNTLRSWDLATGREIHTFVGHQHFIDWLAFAPDGKTLASASWDKTVRLWDVATAREIGQLLGHRGEVWSVTYAPDGKTLASVGRDCTIRLWDVSAAKELHAFAVPISHGTGSVAFAPDGKTLAGAGGDHTVRLWDVARREAVRIVAGHEHGLTSVVYTPDGKHLISAGVRDSRARFWDAVTGAEVHSVAGYHRRVLCSPDGKWLACCGGIGNVLRERRTGQEIRTFPEHRLGTAAGAVSPDGKILALGGWDYKRSLHLWDVASGREIRASQAHAPVSSLAFSPDGETLATGGKEGDVRLWDVATGKERCRFKHGGSIHSIAFAPDGRRLVSAGGLELANGWVRTVRLWDVATAKQVHQFVGHVGEVHWVAYAPDGKTVASAGEDGTVRLWDVATGQERHAFTGHRGEVTSVQFAPDGKTLASAGVDTTVLVWDLRLPIRKVPPPAVAPGR